MALNHEEPDRVPLDFYATPEVWQKLRNYFHVKDDEGVLQSFHVDFRFVGPHYIGPRGSNRYIQTDTKKKRFTDGTWEDFWGIRYKPQKYSKGTYDEICFYPLSQAESIEEIENYPWPSIDWFDYSSISEDCDRYKDYAVYTGWPSVFQEATFIRPMDKVFIDMALKPDFAKALFKKFTDFYCKWLLRTLQAGKDKIDFLHFFDDVGSQNGLLISRMMFKEFVVPNWKRIIDICENFNVKVWLHTCGGVRELIPEFIKLGIDMLDPVQVSARGMVPVELKREFGDRITFHGAVDTQHVLPCGTVEDVKKEVRQRIRELARGGGYVLLPVHAVQPDVPLENILAVYETTLEAGRYVR